MGADPDAQDIDGNTALMLCLDTLFEDEADFEKVKNIIKELIFSGSSRDIKNNKGQTALDILTELKDLLDIDDYNKMQYILTPPKGVRFFRTTRPIEKVERGHGC